MRFVAFALLFCFTAAPASFADSACFKEFRKVVAGKKEPLNLKSAIARKMIQKAKGAYPETSNRISVEDANVYVQIGHIVGFKIDLTDGGDEATVSNYFDADGALLRTYWHNQSPVDTWVCEGYSR